MKVGIGLDNILAGTLPALIRFHNAAYKTDLKMENFTSSNYWEVWGGAKEDAINKMREFYKTDYFKKIKPIINEWSDTFCLKRIFYLAVITSRPDEIADETKEWINKYFPKTFSGIFFADNYPKNGECKTKLQICDSLKIDFLIEDSLEDAIECSKGNRIIMLIDSPWNKSKSLPRNVYRAWDFGDASRYIRMIYSGLPAEKRKHYDLSGCFKEN